MKERKSDQSDENLELILPALRARMGDWVYYISFMTLSEISKRIGRASAFYSVNPQLQELLQRDVLKNRGKQIADYLI